MILVTGATGKVGHQAVAQLLDAGARVRALVRDPATASLPPGAEAVRGDLTDPPSVEAAAAGAAAAFLIWPLMTADAAPAVVDALRGHARRLVHLSARGVPDDGAAEPASGILAMHAALERLVRASGAEWTVLRAGGFAANTLGWADQIRAGDTVRAPYAGATRSLVHEADLAGVAVRALTADGHAGATYRLTGPEALTQADQVRILGEVLGRSLRFAELPPDQAREAYEAQGMPPGVAADIVAAHGRMVTEPETVTPDVAELLGRARTYREWAADHAADFGG